MPSFASSQAMYQAGDSVDVSSWSLFVDGDSVGWPVAVPPPSVNVTVVAESLRKYYAEAGYLLASIDSIGIGSGSSPPVRVYASRGAAVFVDRLTMAGNERVDSFVLESEVEMSVGDTLSARRLESVIAGMLRVYHDYGLINAVVDVASIELSGSDPMVASVRLRINEGAPALLAEVRLEGADRTTPALAMRLTRLKAGQPLKRSDLDGIRARMEESGLFKSVGPPRFDFVSDKLALVIPIVEEDPGAFDVVVGYVPSQGGNGGFVGNGMIELRNVFGGGRFLSLKLNRLPGSISRVSVDLADPYPGGLPVGIRLRFRGFQQDSLYSRQEYGLEGAYPIARGLEIFATVSRDASRPGQAGVDLVDGEQRIPRSEALYTGLGVRFQKVDRRVNPSRGLVVETLFERGGRNRTAREVADGDTLTVRRRLSQQKLTAELRGFIPLAGRHVAMLGLDARALLAAVFDETDLFRFGGAATLRGYSEEQFLARFASRGTLEYRLLVDRRSFAFLFLDVGFVQSAARRRSSDRIDVHPGFGFGFQFDTAIGLVNASYALNPDDSPVDGKIHVGLSFGL